MTSRLVLAAIPAFAAAVLVAAPVAAVPPTGCPGNTRVILTAMLDPLTEIAGPGDANGNGFACTSGARTGQGAIILFDDRT